MRETESLPSAVHLCHGGMLCLSAGERAVYPAAVSLTKLSFQDVIGSIHARLPPLYVSRVYDHFTSRLAPYTNLNFPLYFSNYIYIFVLAVIS